MKNISLPAFVMLMALFVSCGNKSQTEPQQSIKSLDVILDEIALSNKLNSIDLTKVQRLTQMEYDSLQLAAIEGLQGYDINDLTMGNILFENENGKILTIRVITDGEITEYLLSYDKDGLLQDNLLVAYEDMVEYYSEVSSKINSNKIMVQTVNFTYEDESGNPFETSDTAVVNYQITNNLMFINE